VVRSVTRLRERGAVAVVETALVLPIIVLVIVGTIDASRMVTSRMMLAYAVTVGARTATAKANATSDVQNAVIAAAPILNLNTTTNILTTDVTTNATSWTARTSGNTVTVTARYTFTPSNPLFTKIGSRTFTLTSTMTIP
jgi:Flp pilus assembly protein TadG